MTTKRCNHPMIKLGRQIEQELKLDESVANIWPEFGTNRKEQIKCLKSIVVVAPETEPGREQLYHYLSYGWLCGGIIEHASGKNFLDVLEKAFLRPLNIEDELYIGIPPGTESHVATLIIDSNKAKRVNQQARTKKTSSATMEFPSSFTPKLAASFYPLLNNLNVRRAIIPALNLHSSARALARFYAALVDVSPKIFTNTRKNIYDACLGSGNYKDLILQNGQFGLGYIRLKATDGSVIMFGQTGLGGCTAYWDINNRFAISMTLNKLPSGTLPGEIIHFICSELDLRVQEDYAKSRDFSKNPKIN
ncbi:beta-lactamase/transpeptidase-like protein [Tanacetum coccineum]